jgi:RNA polymerase sigma-70 factor (ECF subfamily)
MTEQSVQNREYPTDSTPIESTNMLEDAYAFYPEVLSYLRSHGAGDRAEDVAQETFVKAFKYLDDYEERGNLCGWLITLAKHSLVDHHRRKGTRPLNVTDDAEMLDRIAPDDEADPGTAVVLNLSRDELLANIIANVTPDQADIIKLLIDGYTNTEISEILGVNRATVATRLHRGRKALIAAGIQPLE